jgi:hypothetical protein
MPEDEQGERPKAGRGELAFIVVSAAIFLAIAGCVVYFVARIII